MKDSDDIYGTEYRVKYSDDTMSMYTDEKGNTAYASKINDNDMIFTDSSGKKTYVSSYNEGERTKIYSDGEYFGESYNLDDNTRITRDENGDVIAESRHGRHKYYSNYSNKSTSDTVGKSYKEKGSSAYVSKYLDKKAKKEDEKRDWYIDKINNFTPKHKKLLKVLSIFTKPIKFIANIFFAIVAISGAWFGIGVLIKIVLIILGQGFFEVFNVKDIFTILSILVAFIISITIMDFVENYLENMIYIKDL